MRKSVAVITLAGIVGTVVLSHSREASAQNVQYVLPDGKGITGCALLGAEAVALIQAAAGDRARWSYIVFPLLGAAAGGVGGYFLEQAAGDGSDTALTGLSVGTLVLGLGLVVPTVIAYVNATAYRPEHDEANNEDNAPSNQPIDESGAAPPAEGGASGPPAEGGASGGAPAPAGGGGGASSTPTSGGTSSIHPARRGRGLVASPQVRPTGLFDFTGEGMSLSMPAISVQSSVSLQETRQYGISGQSELRVPILSGSF